MFGLSKKRFRGVSLIGMAVIFAFSLPVLMGSVGRWSPRTASAAFGQVGPGDQITVPINDTNNSGINGTATLTANDGFTTIAIEIDGPAGSYPAHLHTGSCDSFDPTTGFPLSNAIVGEVTQTVVEIPLARLIDANYVINIHAPSTDLNVLITPESRIACTSITSEAAAGNTVTEANATPEGGVGGQTGSAPTAGIGTTFDRDTSMTWIAVLSGLVLFFGFAGARSLRWSRQPATIDRS